MLPSIYSSFSLCSVISKIMIIFLLLLSSMMLLCSAAQLGLAQEDKVADILFADMGKVYIGTFRIDGMNATLDVKIEDTLGE